MERAVGHRAATEWPDLTGAGCPIVAVLEGPQTGRGGRHQDPIELALGHQEQSPNGKRGEGDPHLFPHPSFHFPSRSRPPPKLQGPAAAQGMGPL